MWLQHTYVPVQGKKGLALRKHAIEGAAVTREMELKPRESVLVL